MAITKAQSRTQIQELKTEVEALDAKIADARVAVAQAKIVLDRLQKQREPLTEELAVLVQRHKRLFNEEA